MERSIGVFDSGIGGLTVAQELMRQLPKENFIYLGDTNRCPYGSRPSIEIKKFTLEMVDFLLTKNIKMLVIACNTATAFTLFELEQLLDIPVIGVISPGARAAIKTTKNNHIAVIGTEGTISSNAYKNALHVIHPEVRVTSLACPLLVPMIEQGILTGLEAEQIVKKTLSPINHRKFDFDTLILGCTHYPLISKLIQDVLGPRINIVSSSEETARETSATLDVCNLLNTKDTEPKHQFYTTGELKEFEELTNNIFQSTITNLQKVTIDKVNI